MKWEGETYLTVPSVRSSLIHPRRGDMEHDEDSLASTHSCKWTLVGLPALKVAGITTLAEGRL